MKTRQAGKYLCYIAGVVLYFLAFLGALIFPSLTYLTYQRIARRGFLLSLFLTIIAVIMLQIGKDFISVTAKKQMASIYLIISAIFFPMFIRSLLNGQNVIFGIYHWIEFAFVTAGLLFWSYQLIGCKLSIHFRKEQFYLLLIVSIVIALSIEQLGIVIKGDSVEYYSKIIRICQNFSFNPNDISLLKSSGHCCYSFSLFSTIGENIFPYFGLGVRVENIIIWILCILFVRKILKTVIPDISQPVLIGCVACFAFTPLILGNIQEISVELYVLFFFILFVYFSITKQHILEVFFAICFVFAKEPDILILAGYYLGIFINQVIETLSDKKKEKVFFSKDFILSSLSVYLSITIFCIYFAVDVRWGNNASFDYSNTVAANTFGFNLVYIISKLKQLFILNFAWIPALAIVIGFIVHCINRKKRHNIRNYFFFPLLCSYICFLVIQLFYLTFVLPRYIMLQFFYLIIALSFTLHNLRIPQKAVRCIMPISAVVLLFQNFYNIDFISGIMFDTLDTGAGKMIFDNPLYVGDFGQFITYKEGEIPYIQPYGMTNKQFSYFDKMLELALAEINYSDNDLIIFPQSFTLYPHNFYWGNHLALYYFDIRYNHFALLINEHVPVSDTITELHVEQLGIDYKLSSFDAYDKVYYFDFSFSDEIDNWIHDNYHTQKIHNIQYRGWTLDIYEMEAMHE